MSVERGREGPGVAGDRQQTRAEERRGNMSRMLPSHHHPASSGASYD